MSTLAFILMLGVAPDVHEDGFATMMSEAMAKMHTAMHVAYTGDADRDFARLMIPHHQGAVDMALAEIRYGKDERLRRLAQELRVRVQGFVGFLIEPRAMADEALPTCARFDHRHEVLLAA